MWEKLKVALDTVGRLRLHRRRKTSEKIQTHIPKRHLTSVAFLGAICYWKVIFCFRKSDLEEKGATMVVTSWGHPARLAHSDQVTFAHPKFFQRFKIALILVGVLIYLW